MSLSVSAPKSTTEPSTSHPTSGSTPARRLRTRSTRRGDIAGVVAGLGFGFMVVTGGMVAKDMYWHGPGGVATTLGSIAAIAGTYLCLMLLLLVSRVPWLEREVGHDRMVGWHRWVAPYSLLLIGVHVVLTSIGYGQQNGVKNPFSEFWHLLTHYAWMVPATVAVVLMIGLGVLSYRKIRQRMKYETWWVTHLYFYLAIVLAFGHQITTGPVFTSHPQLRYSWVALYVLVGSVIVVSRILTPIWRSTRRGLRVGQVVEEAPGIVSVYIVGRDLVHFSARGGQFFQWRFLTRHWWWQAHPYSLSAGPRNTWLRITVKDLGDQSGAILDQLKPGTRVIAEGPYGVFTANQRESNRVVLFAAGVGITPVRAVLDDLPSSTDVTLIYRVADMEDIPLRAELEELARANDWKFWYLPGARHQYPMTVNFMSQFAPDLSDSDVYVCGPGGFTDNVVELARSAGLPESRIHHESFVF